MAITFKSVLQTAANNIVSSASRSKGSLRTVKREYNDIVKFLDLEKKQIESIKLPDKKKIAQLANINIASTFGTPGNLLGSLFGGGLDLAGFVGNMFPAKGNNIKAQPKVKGDKLRFGGVKALGVLNSVFAGLDFYQGIRQGEGVGKAASGAGASLAGSIVGGALGSFLGPLGTFAGASLGGMAGGWLGDRAYEGVTGTGDRSDVKKKLERKLKAREAAQKASVQGGNFEDIITRFSSAVSKFEDGVASGLFGSISQSQSKSESNMIEDSDSIEPEDAIDTGNVPQSTGMELEDVEASGGEIPGAPDSAFRTSHRPNHNGNDYFKPVGTAISLIQDGTVTVADMNYDPGGWGALIEISHKDGSLSRYAHMSRIYVAQGAKVSAGQVIGETGGAAGARGSGNSEGPHLHFEYLPSGSGQSDPTQAAKNIFRFGGNVRVKKKNAEANSQQKLKPIDINYPQKKPEEFFKGTPQENIFKDTKLKEEFSGKATTPEVKEAQNKYNEYVNQIRQQRSQQVSTQMSSMVAPASPIQMPQIAQYPSYSQIQSYIIDRPSIIAMGGGGGSSQPVYIPVGGGEGGETTVSSGPGVGEVVNSLIATLLLTNLSAS